MSEQSAGVQEISNKIPMDRAISSAVEPILDELKRAEGRDFDETTMPLLQKGIAVKEVKKKAGFYLTDKISFSANDVASGLRQYVDQKRSEMNEITLQRNVDSVFGPLMANTQEAVKYEDPNIRRETMAKIMGTERISASEPSVEPISEEKENREKKRSLSEAIWRVIFRQATKQN